MKLLAWNLNHRAARRRIPAWIAAAIANEAPHVLVLTEYVEGPDHDLFLSALRGMGLLHHKLSLSEGRHNQILIASQEKLRDGELAPPPLHPAVTSNALHVRCVESGIDILGFRIPAFKPKDRQLKRQTWNWLLGAAEVLAVRKSVIAGDLNTAKGDSKAYCGDCIENLCALGWTHALPTTGYSWRHQASRKERAIDHAFLSPALSFTSTEYSWGFQKLAGPIWTGSVGQPDHAMHVTEIEQVSAPLKARLQALACYLPKLTESGFEFGYWTEPVMTEPGKFTTGFHSNGAVANGLIRTAYDYGWVVKAFNWGDWKSTPEAITLRDDPDALAQATSEQLEKLLTVLIRQDRFAEGALQDAFDIGLLTRILRRAAALETEL